MKKNVGISYKAFAVILAAVLILGGAIGGTMAWLIDKGKPVTNTFTDSDINITLTESEGLDLKMIPGYTITKDPKVTVLAGSEDCYLFVKIDKSENYSEYLEDYVIAGGWTELTGEDDVYYREVTGDEKGQPFSVLKDNKVTVKQTVTKDMMDDIDGKNADGSENNTEINSRPTLTFTAYAVQLNKTNEQKFDVADAWKEAYPLGNQTTTSEA